MFEALGEKRLHLDSLCTKGDHVSQSPGFSFLADFKKVATIKRILSALAAGGGDKSR
ncbi:MAG: hypothetical protein ACRC8D_07925 [Aeromonas sp.]